MSSALQHNPRCVELWVDAASSELEENGNMSTARELLQRGVRLNEHSKHLWLEYLRFELIGAVKLRERQVVLGMVHLAYRMLHSGF